MTVRALAWYRDDLVIVGGVACVADALVAGWRRDTEGPLEVAQSAMAVVAEPPVAIGWQTC